MFVERPATEGSGHQRALRTRGARHNSGLDSAGGAPAKSKRRARRRDGTGSVLRWKEGAARLPRAVRVRRAVQQQQAPLRQQQQAPPRQQQQTPPPLPPRQLQQQQQLQEGLQQQQEGELQQKQQEGQQQLQYQLQQLQQNPTDSADGHAQPMTDGGEDGFTVVVSRKRKARGGNEVRGRGGTLPKCVAAAAEKSNSDSDERDDCPDAKVGRGGEPEPQGEAIVIDEAHPPDDAEAEG
ncbi:unnamed protein product [Lampetra planeri]